MICAVLVNVINQGLLLSTSLMAAIADRSFHLRGPQFGVYTGGRTNFVVGKVSKFQERLFNDNFKAGNGEERKGKGKLSVPPKKGKIFDLKNDLVSINIFNFFEKNIYPCHLLLGRAQRHEMTLDYRKA